IDPQDPDREREREQEHKPIHIGDVRASVVVQMMIAILPEQGLSLAADFLHLQLHAACLSSATRIRMYRWFFLAPH
ncbi:hypothetical protein AVEN_99466-1, partial [Araneus ventricosus]